MQVILDDAVEPVRNVRTSSKDFECGADGPNVKEDIKKLLEALPPPSRVDEIGAKM